MDDKANRFVSLQSSMDQAWIELEETVGTEVLSKLSQLCDTVKLPCLCEEEEELADKFRKSLQTIFTIVIGELKVREFYRKEEE
jgi:hypothetical protein